jgi:hypothetical protein
MSAITPLLVLLPMGEGESVLSLLQRHCEANAIQLQALLKLLAQDTGKSRVDTLSVVLDKVVLNALESRLGLREGQLAHLYLQPVESKDKVLRQGEHEFSQYVRVPSGQPVCPLCLAEDGYARAVWDFVQAPVCTRHAVPLLTTCPDCGKSIQRTRSNLLLCGHCDYDLRDAAPGNPVSAKTLALARFVQSPTMLSLGSADAAFLIDHNFLSKILRLATLPPPGQPWRYALRGCLQRVPANVLLAALEAVGEALDGTHIDTARLRPRLLQRWPYSLRLPEREHSRLLDEALSLMYMDIGWSNLLRFDVVDMHVPTAADLYGNRIPRLFTLPQIEEFLEIDSCLMSYLLRFDTPLYRPGVGNGFDMDEVLSIQRSIPTLMSTDATDQFLGIPGLTSGLADLGLLATAQTASGDRLVHPAALSALLHRLWQAGLPPTSVDTSNTDAVALQDASKLGFDGRKLGWVVSQAIGGSISVLKWLPPYNLASVWVDRRRLAQLADWPASEPGWQANSTTWSGQEVSRPAKTAYSHDDRGIHPIVARKNRSPQRRVM